MLQQRGNIFASRIVVPSRLQPLLRRVEITRSLRTSDAREARRRLGLWEAHIDALFGIVRKHGSAMTRERLDTLTLQYLTVTFDEIEGRLALDWSPCGFEEWGFQLNERCHEISDALARGDLRDTIAAAQAYAPDADEQFQRKLARRMLETQLKGGIAELDAMSGNPLKRPLEIAGYAAPATPAPASASPLISEVARMYSEERITRGAWSPRTANQNQQIFDLIVEMLGDRPIGDITKDDMRQLGLDIPKLPSNMTKKFPGMKPREVLAALEEDSGLDLLQPRSVNKYLQQVRSLFAWAEEHDLIAKTPAAILRDVAEGRAQDARKDLTDEDIRTLFAYIEERAPEPFAIWIPRIMAYTGCRMGEAAQLRASDVRQEKGIWVFDINVDGEQKNLKTSAAARLVPIHPRLIELGLLDFVAGTEAEFLFPKKWRYSDDESRGNVDALSKLLNRWLRKAGIKDKRKAMQSFRATFITRLKDCQIPEYQISQIVGHENNNITTGRYGKQVNLDGLRDVVGQVVLPI